MIISASRRTDIPAFYAEWMIHRIREGFCTVPNPLNRHQVSRISLQPEDVDCIVFWTRNPMPLLEYLPEIQSKPLRFYFQYTLLNYPREIDRTSPGMDSAISAMRTLSKTIGPERIVWRYDPIVMTPVLNPDFHRNNFDNLARQLQGFSRHCVISIMDKTRRSEARLRSLQMTDHRIDHPVQQEIDSLLRDIARSARSHGFSIATCAEPIDPETTTISPGKCIDERLIAEEFKLFLSKRKDPAQRKKCGCIVSRDIGMYNSCLYGCQYCYATQEFEQARHNYEQHNPLSPSLLGYYHVPEPSIPKPQNSSLFDSCQ